MSVKLDVLIGIPIVGQHQGQRTYALHRQAGHMTAADQIARSVKKVLAMGAVHIWVTQTTGMLPPGKGGFGAEMKKTESVSNRFRVQLKGAETA
jgi:hypothetical protein